MLLDVMQVIQSVQKCPLNVHLSLCLRGVIYQCWIYLVTTINAPTSYMEH